MESYEAQFVYVDGYYQKATGKGIPWKRIKISEIPNLKKKAENFNVFVTVQQFCSPQRAEEELLWGSLYFDLDSSEKYPFAIAKEDAKKIMDYFTKVLAINKEFIRVFFSGSKGFHIFVHPRVLNVQPNSKLHLIFKTIALYLESFLDLKTLDTASIYSKRRMMRLVDSIHHKSGSFKIELYRDELEKTEEEIRILAKAPRGTLWSEEEFGNVLPVEEAETFYTHFVESFKQQETIQKLKPQRLIRSTGEVALCVKDLMENHIRKQGTRNTATMALACYFKDQGFSEQDTIAVLEPWALKTPKEFTSTKDAQSLKASTISCVRSIYSNLDYHFICSVMRSLGDEIKCEFAQCEIANEEDQKPEKEILVHLSEASRAEYMGKRLKTKVLVAGKDASPYIIPRRTQFTCTPELEKEGSKCSSCKLAKNGGRYEYILSERDPILLECLMCSNIQQKEVLKRISGVVAKCSKVVTTKLEEANVEELELSPEIDRRLNIETSEEHVTRVGFYIGHNMALNQELEISCYLHADPKTQHVVHIFSEYTSAETSLNGFKMNEKIKKELEVFQPRKNQNINDKFLEIHRDLEFNIHHIWQRTPLFIAFDLVYHSALSFKFQNELLKKGWTELLVLGDSGQAKSTAIQRIAQHYGFGHRISGESARRTGLAWTWLHTGKRWAVSFGLIPRNDKRLVIIDEAGGIDTEELSKLTDMRSEGIADATGGPIPAKTNARTRIIWLTNTKDGTPLSEAPYPVKKISGIFKRAEDIRRLDLAIAVRSGDVSDSIIHLLASSREKVEHIYTSYLCRNLIIWAWTRKPNQIIISNEAEQEILNVSVSMSKKYTSLIPLVEPADQRNRIARLSVAVAARMFSIDEKDKTGETLIVLPEHVKFVQKFMEEQYDGPSLDYYAYSKINKRAFLTDEYSTVFNGFSVLTDSRMLAETLLKMPFFKKNIVEELLGYEKEDMKKVIKLLNVYDMIRATSRGYVVTAAGIGFLKKFVSEPVSEPVKVAVPQDDLALSNDEIGQHYGVK